MNSQQFYSPEGEILRDLETKYNNLLNKQGYYSKGVAALSNRILKQKSKLEKLYPFESLNEEARP
jgi:hypothetical protein